MVSEEGTNIIQDSPTHYTNSSKGEQADDVHELESESTFEGSRERTFPRSATSRMFKDTIYSFDFHPGDVLYTAFQKDGQLIDKSGQVRK